jgi:hypothetical protein
VEHFSRRPRGPARHRAAHLAALGAALGAALLVTGCSAGSPAAPAEHPVAPAASPAAATPGHPDRGAAAAQYLVIADTGNKRLDTEIDHLTGPDRTNLAASSADLTAAAATERSFDRGLSAIAFPPDAAATARLLVTANEDRARLADTAAHATSLPQLHEYEDQLTAADHTVEQQVDQIRKQLALPPPPTS